MNKILRVSQLTLLTVMASLSCQASEIEENNKGFNSPIIPTISSSHIKPNDIEGSPNSFSSEDEDCAIDFTQACPFPVTKLKQFTINEPFISEMRAKRYPSNENPRINGVNKNKGEGMPYIILTPEEQKAFDDEYPVQVKKIGNNSVDIGKKQT